eukprot:8453102-Alexandrium_andersonii.AAC.1
MQDVQALGSMMRLAAQIQPGAAPLPGPGVPQQSAIGGVATPFWGQPAPSPVAGSAVGGGATQVAEVRHSPRQLRRIRTALPPPQQLSSSSALLVWWRRGSVVAKARHCRSSNVRWTSCGPSH